jgi:hypothetical protein
MRLSTAGRLLRHSTISLAFAQRLTHTRMRLHPCPHVRMNQRESRIGQEHVNRDVVYLCVTKISQRLLVFAQPRLGLLLLSRHEIRNAQSFVAFLFCLGETGGKSVNLSEQFAEASLMSPVSTNGNDSRTVTLQAASKGRAPVLPRCLLVSHSTSSRSSGTQLTPTPAL